jgi:hypothetical protein
VEAAETYQIRVSGNRAKVYDCGKRLKEWATAAERASYTRTLEHAQFEFAYTVLECSNHEISEDTIRDVTATFFPKPEESLLSQKRKTLKRQAFVDDVVRLSGNSTEKTEYKSSEDKSPGCYDVLGERWCAKSQY